MLKFKYIIEFIPDDNLYPGKNSKIYFRTMKHIKRVHLVNIIETINVFPRAVNKKAINQRSMYFYSLKFKNTCVFNKINRDVICSNSQSSVQ